ILNALQTQDRTLLGAGAAHDLCAVAGELNAGAQSQQPRYRSRDIEAAVETMRLAYAARLELRALTAHSLAAHSLAAHDLAVGSRRQRGRLVDDVDEHMAALAGSRCFHDGPQRVCRATTTADDAAVVLGRHA